MPPPNIPPVATSLACIVGDTVIEITQRQQTSVSTSDCIRGVAKALKQGLVVVDYTLPVRVTNAAHVVGENGHKDNFCPACAAIYIAVNKAMLEFLEIPESNG